nr:hypothetical protein [Desulfobulbaceae bacterium]
MTSSSNILFLICISIALLGFLEKPSTAEESNCTSACHLDMGDDQHLNPTGNTQCSSCHQKILEPHPQENRQTFISSNSACQKCHPKVMEYKLLHAPVAAGECSACHTPHKNKNNSYLQETETLICYTCHPEVISKSDTVFHGEINQGKCQACHAAHGSDYSQLLKAKYSTSYFNDYNSDHYEFCFKCHKIDLLLHPQTSYNTNFRDGKDNLHYVHVNKTLKGRSCKFCHEIHSGTLPKLMADTVPFGEWNMPINFIINENGGQCAPGCHAPKSYQRNIRNKESAAKSTFFLPKADK